MPTSAAVVAAHVATANRLLFEANHYRKHFGQPMSWRTERGNAEAALANETRYRALAERAGQYAAYSELPADRWYAALPFVADAVLIWDAFLSGYSRAASTLALVEAA